jgi:hypothetical protein
MLRGIRLFSLNQMGGSMFSWFSRSNFKILGLLSAFFLATGCVPLSWSGTYEDYRYTCSKGPQDSFYTRCAPYPAEGWFPPDSGTASLSSLGLAGSVRTGLTFAQAFGLSDGSVKMLAQAFDQAMLGDFRGVLALGMLESDIELLKQGRDLPVLSMNRIAGRLGQSRRNFRAMYSLMHNDLKSVLR